MIFRNALLEIEGATHRLLETEPEKNVAWVISMDDFAMPKSVGLSDISGLETIEHTGERLLARVPTEAERSRRDKAVKALRPLLVHGTALFDDVSRFQLIKKHAKVAGVSTPSLYKWLRMYWQNGQCDDALTPNYRNCGISLTQITAGRGAKARHDVETYQLCEEDIQYFEQTIQTVYFADKRESIVSSHQRLLEKYYSYLDGNGHRCLKSPGYHPTLRQFSYYLKATYPLEVRMRARLGDKTFERNHRAVLGTVEQDCLGVGHIYECDATVADVYLVAEDDIGTIVGKPVIYYIIDRWSRLIVGFYVGFENASWTVAMQALLSISEDKEALCRRYGIEYRREDWPAHCVFPIMFLGDMGELHGLGGGQLSEGLYTRVAFTPGQRPDWKPIVETGHKQTRVVLQAGTPGFDPPENAKQRQALHYDKESCLTLTEFTRQLLELILMHNRRAMREYEFSMQEAREKFLPTPVNVWNRGIATRSGALSRYTHEHMRFKLLPRETGRVTMNGVLVKGCYYTSPELVRRGWFVQARATKRFSVDVALDYRLVNNVYVIDDQGEPILCELTPESQKHRGRSFAEVKVYELAVGAVGIDIEHDRKQAMSDYHAVVDEIHDAGRTKLKSAPKQTRSARKADTKDAREAALTAERQETGRLKPANPPAVPHPPHSSQLQLSTPDTTAASASAVVDFRVAKKARENQAVLTTATPAGYQPVSGLPDKDEMTRRTLERMRKKGNTK